MKRVFDFVKNIFGFNNGEMPWVYIAGEGRWERRRPARPLVRIGAFAAGVLAVAGIGFYLMSPSDNALAQAQASQNLQALQNNKDLIIREVQMPSELAAELELNARNVESKAESEPEPVQLANNNLNNLEYEDLDLNLPPVKDEKPEVNVHKANKVLNNNNNKDLKDYWIKINKGSYTLALYKGDEIVKEYEIAVGKNPGDKQRKGDHRTPVGDFRIVSIEDASSWKHDFGDGKGKIAGAYGPWFMRLDAGGWKGIGIHGTHDPDSLGTMASEGCIRMDNGDLRELKNFAYRKMRVLIQE